MESVELIIDMSNWREKNFLLGRLRELRGWWRIEVVKYRKRRTDRQNRYYHPCFVEPLADFMRAQGEPVTHEDAHRFLKEKFLLVKSGIPDPETGEVIEYTKSTSRLSTVEFNLYLDQCAAWLLKWCNITVPPPDVYREQEETQP